MALYSKTPFQAKRIKNYVLNINENWIYTQKNYSYGFIVSFCDNESEFGADVN